METVANSAAVSVGFFFPIGSALELNPDTYGITHLWEHMIFKGTAKRSARDIALQVESLGGEINAFTDKTEVGIHVTVPHFSLNPILELLVEMVFFSLFDQTELQKEKQVIISEINGAEDDPEDYLFESFAQKLWHNSGFGHPVTGSKDSLKKVTSEILQDWAHNSITSDQLVVSVAGNFSETSLLEKLNNILPDSPRRQPSEYVMPEVQPLVAHLKKKLNQTHLIQGYSFTQKLQLEESLYLQTFSSLYGEMMSSRLFQSVREKAGLVYSIYSNVLDFPGLTGFTITANTKPKHLAAVLDILHREWAAVCQDGITDTEWQTAVNYQSGALILAMERMEARVFRLFDNFLKTSEAVSTNDFNETILHLDHSTASQFLHQHLFSCPASQMTLGELPPKGKKVKNAL